MSLIRVSESKYINLSLVTSIARREDEQGVTRWMLHFGAGDVESVSEEEWGVLRGSVEGKRGTVQAKPLEHHDTIGGSNE